MKSFLELLCIGAAICGALSAAEKPGVRYSDVINPATGLGLAKPVTVTVIARHATRADSLATACNVLAVAAGE